MINKINKLAKIEFIKVFANIFENSKWIAEELHKQRPFESFEDLSSKMILIFKVSTKEQKLEVLNKHPSLADKTKIGSLTKDSLNEQTTAGLDQCSKEEFEEFKNLNIEYKKFGFPFILAVKGKSKNQILENFKKRINSNQQKEFDEAVKQVIQIASLRLEELKKKNF
tara:strand:+ start:1083 stop:1586 length:504 start_codon:yes stop_codon:yes gene_type:complete